MIKKILLLVIYLEITSGLKAQDVPLYLHTFNNMYLQNPAAAGLSKEGVLYATVHKQFIGSFADSPEHASISGNTLLPNEKTGIGGNVYFFRRSLLKTTGALLTLSHQVDFGDNHNLRVGISGGFVDNFIDLNGIENPTDPALLNRINNRLLVDGQVGAYYRLQNFAFGAGLPKLFKYFGFANVKDPKENIYPLQNYFFSASYRFEVSSQVSLIPLVFYRKFENADPNWEGNLMVNFKETAWTGMSYRTEYGTAVIGGLRAKNFSLSYAFKLPNQGNTYYSNAAHEIQLGYHFGKKKKIITEKTAETQPEPVALKINEKPKEPATAISQAPDTVKTLTQKIEPETSKPETKDIRVTIQGNHPLELIAKYYVIVGTFMLEDNAKRYIQQLKVKNKTAALGFNSGLKRFHVYLFDTENKEEALKLLQKTKTELPEAWILKVEK